MAITFKGERTVAELNNNLVGFVKDSAFRIYDHGTLLKGNVPVKHGDFVSWTGTRWKIEPSLEYATSADVEAIEEQIESIGDVKYVDRHTSYSDVAAAISRGQLPIMTIVSGGTTYYYFPFYNGSGGIEFRSIQDGSIDCFTWNGTAWVAGDSVIYGMGSDTKSEVDIDQGVLAIDGGNVVTKVTLATVNAVTFSVDENVPAFAIEIDNTGNGNDVDVTVVNGAATLKYSSAAGNQVGAGKYMQLTCVGNCWTLAEFKAPTP